LGLPKGGTPYRTGNPIYQPAYRAGILEKENEMNKSPSITKLAEALAKAQAEMPVVKFNAQNPFLKNKYADLGAVIATSRAVLARHGLSISQFPTSEGDKIGITTVLMHSGGEWMESNISIVPTDAKGLSYAQASGVVISYLRRYAWASVLGLYADEDTDGHTVMAKQPRKQTINERYTELLKEAEAAGVDVKAWQLPENCTDNEVVELGKNLRAEVEKREK